jgi:hypothetical protein
MQPIEPKPPIELNAIQKAAIDSAFFHALCAVVASAPVVFLIGWAIGMDSQLTLQIFVWCVVFIFGAVLMRHVLHLWHSARETHYRGRAATMKQALAVLEHELAAKKIYIDLNGDGQIGLPSGEVETSKSRTRADFMRHVSEFWEMVAVKKIRDGDRKYWLGYTTDDGTEIPAYQWRGGTLRCDREEYDAIMELLESTGRWEGRRRGRAGVPVLPTPPEDAETA